MVLVSNPWDEFATEYEQEIVRRGPLRADDDGMAARMVRLLGDLRGKAVLDAACGGGVLARLLESQGAHVMGLDLSPRLIEMANRRNPGGRIRYRVADLSRPQPEFAGRFDAIGSYLALNDVADHHGFARTLAMMAKPAAPVVLAFNNPYSAVVREHVKDYSATGTLATYAGMWQRGIKARYYHRTLEDFLDAFLAAGLELFKLVDVPDTVDRDWLLPPGTRFPMFMILGFRKGHADEFRTSA